MRFFHTFLLVTFGAGLAAAAPLSWSEETYEKINALRAKGVSEQDIARNYPMGTVPDHSRPIEALSFSQAYSTLAVHADEREEVPERGLKTIFRHLCGGAWLRLGDLDEDLETKREEEQRLELRGIKQKIKAGRRAGR